VEEKEVKVKRSIKSSSRVEKQQRFHAGRGSSKVKVRAAAAAAAG
jgi:hypothetical protein